MVEDLRAFRQRFGLGCPTTPQLLSAEQLAFRLTLIDEERQEFGEAHERGDLPEAADALIDLVYVVMGTAIEMGLPWDELWADVQRANMSKVRATSAEDSKRSSVMDVVKPPGWIPPQGAKILARAIERAAREQEAASEQQLTYPLPL